MTSIGNVLIVVPLTSVCIPYSINDKRVGQKVPTANKDNSCNSYMIPVDVVPRVSAGRLVIGI